MLQDTPIPSVLSATESDDRHPSSRSALPAAEANKFSADTYADRLMDDLFQDVEQLLDMAPPAQTVAPEETVNEALQPFSATEITPAEQPGMPLAKLPPFGAMQSIDMDEPRDLAPVEPNAIAPQPSPQAIVDQATQRQLDRLMLAVGCVSVVASLALWLLYQQGWQQRQLASLVPTAPETVTETVATPADVQFSQYLQKSLQQIDQQTQPANTTTVVLPGLASATLHPAIPGLPTVNNPGTAVSSLPNSGTTPLTLPGSARPSASNDQLPANLYPPGSGIAPLPSLPNKTTPHGSTTPSAHTGKTANSPVIGVPSKLVGVLDQGEQSVALFEINGITQRYGLGESIGSSGWTLVEVSKNQAVIRRNGEVRSLFVGNSF